jgi:hypothetical protein
MKKQIGDRFHEGVIYLNLAIHYLRYSGKMENALEIAYNHCMTSIDVSESIGGKLLQEKHQIGYYSAPLRYSPYEIMVKICIELKKYKEALEYIERGKSKALLSMLSSTEIQPSDTLKKEYPDLVGREKVIRSTLTEIQTRHLRNNNTMNAAMDQRRNIRNGDASAKWDSIKIDPTELGSLQNELNGIYTLFKKIDEEYVGLRLGRPLAFDNIQDLL